MGIHWTLRFSMMRCGPLLTNAGQNDILQKLPKFLRKWRTARLCRNFGNRTAKNFLCGRSGVEHHHGGRCAVYTLSVKRNRAYEEAAIIVKSAEYKANEKFSGKGHAAHVCKSCASLPPEKQAEQMTINRLLNLPWRLSKRRISWLKNRMKDKRREVRALAKEQYEMRVSSRAVKRDIEDNFDFLDEGRFNRITKAVCTIQAVSLEGGLPYGNHTHHAAAYRQGVD